MAAATPKYMAFMAPTRLGHRAELIAGEGCSAVVDLADAGDDDLPELGLKKPEIKRLRKAILAGATAPQQPASPES